MTSVNGRGVDLRIVLALLAAPLAGLSCGSDSAVSAIGSKGGAGTGGAGGAVAGGASGGGAGGTGGGFVFDIPDAGMSCVKTTCAALGWACGTAVDKCGNVIDCAAEGRACREGEVCIGGVDGPTQCTAGIANCDLCTAVPDCKNAAGPTRLSGRVVTPGRADADRAAQIGVPNAVVYILTKNDVAELPVVGTGIPSDGARCDRCEDEDLGPVLAGAVTDAAGRFTIEGNVPVGVEFVLVVKAGKFRRAVKHTLPANAACQTTALPDDPPANPLRLPRNMSDGLAVNIPRVAVTTGRIDAIECVFWKMGLDTAEFGNGAAASTGPRVHLYRGGPAGTPSGARLDDSTPHDAALYGDAARLRSYDTVVADCEAQDWDSNFSQRNAQGANVLDYVNRGGRLFASHLSFSWLHENGTAAYSAGAPFATGLGPAATWSTDGNANPNINNGTGRISIGRPNASPRVGNFASWMQSVGITTANDMTFAVSEPRSRVTALGGSSEEFTYCDGGDCRTDYMFTSNNMMLTANTLRPQQFSFNTPYGAPAAAACGRVAYSGFHVAAGGASVGANPIFPNLCQNNNGTPRSLTNQEKVLLYMLFDLGACVGTPPLPMCTPATCESLEKKCGLYPDGCGKVIDCGRCVID